MKWKLLCVILGIILLGLILFAATLENPGEAPVINTEDMTEHPTEITEPTKESAATVSTGSTEAETRPTEAETEPTEVTTAPTQPPTVPEESVPETQPPVKRYTVCIDAGHQQAGIPEKEPIGPGATQTKAKLSSGTQGVATGIEEYKLNLDVSLLLEQELLARGYQVVMIRRSNDCPLSNAERAVIANESGADIFVRIHANGSEDPSMDGMLCCAPTQNNPFLTKQTIAESIRLSQIMTEKFCAQTGARNRGLYSVDTMTGINWCTIPVTIVEMGYMSNPEEDRKMASDAYREKMVQGMADGIDAYFATKDN